jgi:ribA/ribD-fused uncharacterized protein
MGPHMEPQKSSASASGDVVITEGPGYKYVFFCRLSEPNPWFSNWYISGFRVDGMAFSCVEQYMMWSKACRMEDAESAQKIMATGAPKEIKALGRKVRNFDVALWDRVKEDVVYTGCLAKFQQNMELKRMLLATGDAVFVEAADYDCVWGAGLSSQDARIRDEKKWLGLNLLGKVLMRVRTCVGTSASTATLSLPGSS